MRASVIGLGFIGAGDPISGHAIGQRVEDLEGTHAAALANHPKISFVAGSSRDAGRRERFTHRYPGTRAYADWAELLAEEKPEIVCIATNSPQHAEIAIACAEAGTAAILCEKPLATRLADADRILAACAASGTLLAVNHTRRWHPLWRTAKAEMPALGAIQFLTAHWSSGRLGNIGTHMFDAAAFLLSDSFVGVSGTLDRSTIADCRGPQFKDPGGWGIVSFAGGTKLFVNAGHSMSPSNTLRIEGSHGRMTIQRNEIVIESFAGETRTIGDSPDRPSGLDLAVEDLIRCLEDGSQPACTSEDGRAALEVIVGFHISNRADGRMTPLPLDQPDRDLEILIG